jgi:hypothetical protein
VIKYDIEILKYVLKNLGQFMDPPGTVTMIEREKYGNPSEHIVDFSKGEGR